jgi:small subunit ribosomal protein S17
VIEEEDKTEDQQEPQEAEEAPEEAPAEESAEEAPAEEPAAESTEDSAPETDPDTPGSEAEDVSGGDSEEASGSDAEEAAGDDLPWKTRKRLERSRQPTEALPQRSAEERQTERSERRDADAALRRRHRQSRRNRKGEPGTGTPVAEPHPNPSKVRQGIVISDAANKTITVRIDIARRHPTYEKVVRRSRTLSAHDESNEAGQGDVVRIIETRPLSKSKRWRLVEVVEKAK